jgi:hypothetical protein
MQSPPFPRYLVPSRSIYSPQHHVLKHPQLPFLPQCRRPSFTPIQNNRQNYSLYILIFTFLDSNLEDKRFCTSTHPGGLRGLYNPPILFMFRVVSLHAKLNTICHLLALLGAHHILHVSRIRVKLQLFSNGRVTGVTCLCT